jgi:hypothetical protein
VTILEACSSSKGYFFTLNNWHHDIVNCLNRYIFMQALYKIHIYIDPNIGWYMSTTNFWGVKMKTPRIVSMEVGDSSPYKCKGILESLTHIGSRVNNLEE